MEDNMEAPERVFIAWPDDNGCGLAFTVPSKAGQNRTEFVRADLAAPSAPAQPASSIQEFIDAASPMLNAPAEVDGPEEGETRTLAVTAVWKPCVHGGGWWIAKDADGCKVLLSSDTPQVAPSAPAEVEGLVRWKHSRHGMDMAMDSEAGDWMRYADHATALTALQAENERLRKERDDWKKSWREVLSAGYEMKARAEKSEVVADKLGEWLEAIDARREFGDENPENVSNEWDRLFSAEEAAMSAARAAHAKLKGDV